MASLTDVQVSRCLNTMQRAYDLPIAVYFRQPVDPVLDDVPDYHEKVVHAVDMTTIMQGLRDGAYTSVDQWKEDVRLIYKNSATYHGDAHMMTVLAREVVEFCHLKWDVVPKTEWEMWTYRVRKTQRKLAAVLACRPEAAPRPRTPKLVLKVG